MFRSLARFVAPIGLAAVGMVAIAPPSQAGHLILSSGSIIDGGSGPPGLTLNASSSYNGPGESRSLGSGLSKDDVGEEGGGTAIASIAGGSVSVFSHACTGPLPFSDVSLGTAHNNSFAGLEASILVVSSTLPTGTLVDVRFRGSAAVSPKILFKGEITSLNDLASGGAGAVIQAYTSAVNFRFEGSYGEDLTGRSQSGLFGGSSSVDATFLGLAVGSRINVSVNVFTTANAASTSAGVAIAEFGASALYGLSSTNPLVSLIEDTGGSIPGIETVTPGAAAAAIPPNPVTSMMAPVPEPATIISACLAVGSGLVHVRRRKARNARAR